MEGTRYERYTDNYPLDRGKISAMEGGTRVQLIIVGPQIPAGVQTDVLANGLDFYPTILSMAGIAKPKQKILDGADLFPLLTQDPTDPSLVKDENGQVRDTMIWHFPHGNALESTIRIGDYKLVHNYDSVNNPSTEAIELYRLYDSTSGAAQRVDIEESHNLASQMPEKAQAMYQELVATLTEMKASYPSYNPNTINDLPHKLEVPTVLETRVKGNQVAALFKENGAKVVHADLIYTLNGGERYEEWFRTPATVNSNGWVTAELPAGTTHYIFNLIDENNFLVSYPDLSEMIGKTGYADLALKVSK
jgi:uncharacterized sulfatase